MLRFDSHVHIGDSKIKISSENSELLAYRTYSPVTPEGYMRKALACGISKAVIFPFPLMEIPFERQNSYVMEAAKKFPYFFIPFLIPETIEKMELYKNGFVGIKDHFYFDFHNQVNRDEILDYAQAYDKVYLFHAHWKHWNDRVKQISKISQGLGLSLPTQAALPHSLGGIYILKLMNSKKLSLQRYEIISSLKHLQLEVVSLLLT